MKRARQLSVPRHDPIRRILTPIFRAYLRYAPWSMGKCRLWSQVVNSYFAWHPYEFVAPTRFGALLAGNTIDILQQYIYYFGMWEPQLTRWISRRLRKGDTFIDVGANIGYFSLLASQLVGETGRVISVEASPRTFRTFQENLKRNEVRNVRAVNMAVSDTRGVVNIFRGPETNIGLSTILDADAARKGYEFEARIEAAPLVEILRPEEIETVRLLKIDVEGAEWRVISCILPLLDAGRRDLEVILEISPNRLARQAKRADMILDLFLKAGFHAYTMENDYSAESYLAPFVEKKPSRLRHVIESETDTVFSRVDAEAL